MREIELGEKTPLHVVARGPCSERALRRRPCYFLPFVSFAHLYGARPEGASFSLPFCPIFPRFGARASLSLPFLLNLPPLWRAALPRSERSVNGPVIICLLFHLPIFMALGSSGPAFHCLSAQFSPVVARGLSGPAYHCLSAQLPPVMARNPSSERAFRRRPSYHLPLVSFAHLYGARPERASFSLPFSYLPTVPISSGQSRFGDENPTSRPTTQKSRFVPICPDQRPKTRS